MHGAAHPGIMIAKKKGQRLVLLPIIERHSLLAVRSRALWLADPEHSWTHCVMSLKQERPIAQSFGECEKFVGNRASHVPLFSSHSIHP
jgi:hypothetical protein